MFLQWLTRAVLVCAYTYASFLAFLVYTVHPFTESSIDLYPLRNIHGVCLFEEMCEEADTVVSSVKIKITIYYKLN